MSTPAINTDTVHKLKHDLRGPAVNVRGFAGEISKALHELTAEIEQYQHQLPQAFSERMASIVANDLHPCLEFLDKASQQFEERINAMAETLLSGETVIVAETDSAA